MQLKNLFLTFSWGRGARAGRGGQERADGEGFCEPSWSSLSWGRVRGSPAAPGTPHGGDPGWVPLLCPVCRSCAFQGDAPAVLPALPGARGEETSPGRKLVLTTCSGRGELGEPLEEGARSRARLRLGQVCAGSSETQKHLAGIWIMLLFFPFLRDIWLFSNHYQILVKCRGFSFFFFFFLLLLSFIS